MLALLLCLAVPVLAKEGVNVEVIKMDGVSVIVFTPAETARQARGIAEENVTVYGAKGSEAERFATENGFAFAEIGGETSEEPAASREAPPVELPFVPR